MYQTKLVLKWNKTDEISVYPTKRSFSKNTDKKTFRVPEIFLTSRKESYQFISL